MQVVLHSNACHLAIIVLIILDVVIVLFELLLDIGALGELFGKRGTGVGKEFLVAWAILYFKT